MTEGNYARNRLAATQRDLEGEVRELKAKVDRERGKLTFDSQISDCYVNCYTVSNLSHGVGGGGGAESCA